LDPQLRRPLGYIDQCLQSLKNDQLHRFVLDALWDQLEPDDTLTLTQLAKSTHSLRWRVIRDCRVCFEGASQTVRSQELKFIMSYLYSPGQREQYMERYLALLKGTVDLSLAEAQLPANDVATLIAREKLTALLTTHNDKWRPAAVPVEGEPGSPPLAVLIARQQELLRELTKVTEQLAALAAQ
jgi:hypothetical protein